jgi:hypothetical protein
MKPSKKIYKVSITSIEEVVEFRNFDSKNVVATDAIHAASRVRLVKTQRKQTFIHSVEMIAEIDKL